MGLRLKFNIVQQTQRDAGSIEEFFKLLADNIPAGDEQAEFLKKMKGIRPGKSAPAPSAFATGKAEAAAGGTSRREFLASLRR